ncbi:glutathione S-transferase E14-like [Vanessa cardui]|uniref:glutathione S-transferase E14-like n=1 Tax=Vanessa cardui TaxID=171605 RepID=UPI001F14742F|nr:glutathione S-transferase E14-like [Vanessa cardui]
MLRLLHKNIPTKMLQYCNLSYARTSSFVKPIVYGDEVSPPVRFVLMTASILKIDIEFHKIDLFKNENRTDFYREINPLQKVPALQVGDLKILDSHAIALYLCQIADDKDLYPQDPALRAKVNQMLFFNSSTLFRIDSYIMSKYFARQPVNKTTVEEWYAALDYLEYNLNDNWLGGNKMLLCDICAVAVVTSMLPLFSLTKRHKRVKQWIENFQCLPFYDINRRGLVNLRMCIDAINNVRA